MHAVLKSIGENFSLSHDHIFTTTLSYNYALPNKHYHTIGQVGSSEEERKKKKYECQRPSPLLLGVISLEEECGYEQQVKQDQSFTDVGSLGGVGLGTGKYKEHEECGVD